MCALRIHTWSSHKKLVATCTHTQQKKECGHMYTHTAKKDCGHMYTHTAKKDRGHIHVHGKNDVHTHSKNDVWWLISKIISQSFSCILQARKHTHTRTDTHTYTRTHTYTHTHAHTHTHTHAHIYTHRHTRAHIYTHTHIRTHTCWKVAGETAGLHSLEGSERRCLPEGVVQERCDRPQGWDCVRLYFLHPIQPCTPPWGT